MKKLQLNGKDERGVAVTTSLKSLPLATGTQVNFGVLIHSLSSIPLFGICITAQRLYTSNHYPECSHSTPKEAQTPLQHLCKLVVYP